MRNGIILQPKFRAVSLAAALVLFVGFSGFKDAAETIVVSGTVMDSTGKPVSGAVVLFAKMPDITGVTGVDGTFSIRRDALFRTASGDTIGHRPESKGFFDTLQVFAAGYYPLDTPLSSYTVSFGELGVRPLKKAGGMVLIPSMGRNFPRVDTNNLVVRPVENASFAYNFWMDTVPVTQAAFRLVMGFNPSSFKGNEVRPVERVTWMDAVRYCIRKSIRDHRNPCYDTASGWKYLRCDITKNGYRLPDDVEWQFSAKGGMVSRYYWGYDTSAETVSKYVWDQTNSAKQTHPVAMKAPNAYDLYDMVGNVWTWCYNNDANYDTSADAPKPIGSNPGYTTIYRVIRGASWSNYYDVLRPHETRGVIAPDYHSYCLGFRCVQTADNSVGGYR
jgi:formylglycine-generating enzyme required for sulfatase activity